MKMKKGDLILIGGVILIILLCFLVFKTESNKIEVPVKLEGDAGFIDITYAEYEEKIDSEKPFMVVIVNNGCGYCEMYIPVIEEVVSEYKLPIYKLNLANLTNDEYNKLSNSNSYLKREKWGTPTTLLMQGSQVIDSIGGYTEKDSVVDFLEEDVVLVKNVVLEDTVSSGE